MATLAENSASVSADEPAFKPTHWTQRLPDDALDHIPGDAGLPVVGNTFRMLADPPKFSREMIAKYGRVYKNKAFGGWQVAMVGADANELMLLAQYYERQVRSRQVVDVEKLLEASWIAVQSPQCVPNSPLRRRERQLSERIRMMHPSVIGDSAGRYLEERGFVNRFPPNQEPALRDLELRRKLVALS